MLLCKSSLIYEIVIKKGRGIRPVEALATLYLVKEGAKFYRFGKITRDELHM